MNWEQIVGLLGGGGLLGYLLRGWLDERFRRTREEREWHRRDLQEQLEGLLTFLGTPRAHYYWLLYVDPKDAGKGDPPVVDKVRLIADWVNVNAPKYNAEVRTKLEFLRDMVYRFPQHADAHGSRMLAYAIDRMFTELQLNADSLRLELAGRQPGPVRVIWGRLRWWWSERRLRSIEKRSGKPWYLSEPFADPRAAMPALGSREADTSNREIGMASGRDENRT